MLKLSVILLLSIVLFNSVAGQTTEPKDVSTLNKVAQEHDSTRKFMSDELSRQKNQFFEEWDDRANYYEKTFNSFVNNLVWRLGLIWFGIMLFHYGVNTFLSSRLEKKKWAKMKDSVSEEVYKKVIDRHKVKGTDDNKKAIEEAKPQIEALKQQIKAQQDQMSQLILKLGGNA